MARPPLPMDGKVAGPVLNYESPAQFMTHRERSREDEESSAEEHAAFGGYGLLHGTDRSHGIIMIKH